MFFAVSDHTGARPGAGFVTNKHRNSLVRPSRLVNRHESFNITRDGPLTSASQRRVCRQAAAMSDDDEDLAKIRAMRNVAARMDARGPGAGGANSLACVSVCVRVTCCMEI